MRGGGEASHTLDLDHRGSRPADFGAHLPQELRQVLDLGFPGRIADHRGSPSHRPGEEQVLGGADGGELERHFRAA